jgi:PAS domain S-box-containing protein
MFTEPSSLRRPVPLASPLLKGSDEHLLAAFLDRAPLPICVVDDERRITAVNGSWVELFGYPAARARTMRVDDFVAPESRGGLGLRWSDLMEAGAGTARVAVLRADGERLGVRYTALANVAPGKHVAMFLVQPAPVAQRPERRRRVGMLTPREQESLRLVAMGLTTTAAAERLGISPETVRTHVRNAMNKLGARTRAQAIAVAMRDGEIPS